MGTITTRKHLEEGTSPEAVTGVSNANREMVQIS